MRFVERSDHAFNEGIDIGTDNQRSVFGAKGFGHRSGVRCLIESRLLEADRKRLHPAA